MEETGCHAKYVKHFQQIKRDTKGTFEPTGVFLNKETLSMEMDRGGADVPSLAHLYMCVHLLCTTTLTHLYHSDKLIKGKADEF